MNTFVPIVKEMSEKCNSKLISMISLANCKMRTPFVIHSFNQLLQNVNIDCHAFASSQIMIIETRIEREKVLTLAKHE